MHKEQLSFVTMTPFTDFLITSSVDGVVKFWKKVAVGIEFVKEFRAHIGEIKSVSVSSDGRSFASAGVDNSVKIFDVITFGKVDLLEFPPKLMLTQGLQTYCLCLPLKPPPKLSAGSISVARPCHYWLYLMRTPTSSESMTVAARTRAPCTQSQNFIEILCP